MKLLVIKQKFPNTINISKTITKQNKMYKTIKITIYIVSQTKNLMQNDYKTNKKSISQTFYHFYKRFKNKTY